MSPTTITFHLSTFRVCDAFVAPGSTSVLPQSPSPPRSPCHLAIPMSHELQSGRHGRRVVVVVTMARPEVVRLNISALHLELYVPSPVSVSSIHSIIHIVHFGDWRAIQRCSDVALSYEIVRPSYAGKSWPESTPIASSSASMPPFQASLSFPPILDKAKAVGMIVQLFI